MAYCFRHGVAISVALLLAAGCAPEPPAPGASSVEELRDILYRAHRDNDMDLMRSILFARAHPQASVWPEEEEMIERLLERCEWIEGVEAVLVGKRAEWAADTRRIVASPYDMHKFVLHGVWRIGEEAREERHVDPAYVVIHVNEGVYAINPTLLVLRDAVEALEEGREPRYRFVASE